MSTTPGQKIADEVIARYRAKTQQSAKLHAEAKKIMPGGETREVVTYKPYPAFMERGKGCYVFDYDGNEYIDFVGNYTSLIHGHCDPDINAAIRAQLDKGTALASPTVLQVEHAKILCNRIPSVDMVRYTNSGTEATLMAIRTARAVKRKDMIIKFEGAYHGTQDDAKVNVVPDLAPQGLPKAHVEGLGIPQSTLQNVVVAPFNDLDAVETLLKQYQDKLAGIICEPFLASLGTIPPKPGFLQGLRSLADRYGVLLIFDEVQSFRQSTGGMQLKENVMPDITAVGKLIGGGYPIGAFGAGRDIMDRFDYDPMNPDAIQHSGTFNGNEISMTAGIASMKKFDQKAVDHINGLGKRLADGFTGVFKALGLKCQALRVGSQLNINFTDKELSNALEWVMSLIPCMELQRLVHLELLNRGIYSAKRSEFVISTPMTAKEVDVCVQKVEETFAYLLPYIQAQTPHLL